MNLGIESETLEFKKTTAEVKAACNSICAMLNKHGIACLYFGVKPNGDVVGQDVSESSLRDVSRAVYDNIKQLIFSYSSTQKSGYPSKIPSSDLSVLFLSQSYQNYPSHEIH